MSYHKYRKTLNQSQNLTTKNKKAVFSIVFAYLKNKKKKKKSMTDMLSRYIITSNKLPNAAVKNTGIN